MESAICVSVCCITYNQEKYIRECLDSILMQNARFPFEIIVHDDASSDATPEILKEYEAKSGGRIRLLLQKQNQYSQGVMILRDIVLQHAKGKYIAFCEGDDFWADTDKLQKQFDAMEAHPEASWCAHYVQCVNEKGEEIDGLTLPPTVQQLTGSTIMTSAQTLEFLIHNGIQMTSYFIRKESFFGFYTHPPKFVLAAPVEDEAIVRYCASAGKLVFLPEKKSCYRMEAEGSWTLSNTNKKGNMMHHYQKLIEMLLLFDEHTNRDYAEIIHHDIINKEWKAASCAGDYRAMMSSRYKEYRRQLPLKSRLKVFALALVAHEK